MPVVWKGINLTVAFPTWIYRILLLKGIKRRKRKERYVDRKRKKSSYIPYKGLLLKADVISISKSREKEFLAHPPGYPYFHSNIR